MGRGWVVPASIFGFFVSLWHSLRIARFARAARNKSSSLSAAHHDPHSFQEQIRRSSGAPGEFIVRCPVGKVWVCTFAQYGGSGEEYF
jgi:hypothetical protein